MMDDGCRERISVGPRLCSNVPRHTGFHYIVNLMKIFRDKLKGVCYEINNHLFEKNGVFERSIQMVHIQ